MSITEQKKELRKIVKQRKAELSHSEKLRLSNTIWAKVEQLPEFKSAKTILAYWAMSDEVQTQDFILRWQAEKRFILPVINGDELELREFNGVDELKECDNFKVLEPHAGKLVDTTEIDLIIVPGVAFDKQGNRLGRGKAYYDKLLRNSVVYKIAVCFECQIVDNVPVECTDIQMDKIVHN